MIKVKQNNKTTKQQKNDKGQNIALSLWGSITRTSYADSVVEGIDLLGTPIAIRSATTDYGTLSSVVNSLTMRTMTKCDLPALNAALADTNSEDGLHFTGLGNPLIDAQAWQSWRTVSASRGDCVSFAGFGTSGDLLGEVALSDLCSPSRHATLSYWIRGKARRQGLGFSMANAMCDYGFSNRRLLSIKVVVSSENIASLFLARALGGKVVTSDNLHGRVTFAIFSSVQ